MSWQPLSGRSAWQTRAALYREIHRFFEQCDVLQVETPLLGNSTVTEPFIESFAVQGNTWLQTSPEYYMKRLLAAGSGDIYQIGKVFRREEQGRLHNREFTLLEWYRTGFDQWDLMAEVAALIEQLLGFTHFEHISYQALFEQYLGLNPHTATLDNLRATACRHIDVAMVDASKDDWLNLLISHLIEPELAQRGPLFVYDYPPSQAALAAIGQDKTGQPVAERFELYINGIELANGFHELADASAQRHRFEHDNHQRQIMGLGPMPLDEALLQALAAGLPDCAGVALGLDRVLMLRLGCDNIEQVLTFR